MEISFSRIKNGDVTDVWILLQQKMLRKSRKPAQFEIQGLVPVAPK